MAIAYIDSYRNKVFFSFLLDALLYWNLSWQNYIIWCQVNPIQKYQPNNLEQLSYDLICTFSMTWIFTTYAHNCNRGRLDFTALIQSIHFYYQAKKENLLPSKVNLFSLSHWESRQNLTFSMATLNLRYILHTRQGMSFRRLFHLIDTPYCTT